MTSGEFSFKRFAQQELYKAVNRRLVELAEIRRGQRVVDLACGTGQVTRLILDKLKDARDTLIIAVDYSDAALRQAADEMKNVRDAAVQFVQSRAEQLSQAVKGSVDTVILCNAIHYMQDKVVLLSEVHKTLRPGGTFAFNTSFFKGGHPAESEQFYRRWMFKALRILKTEYGLSPARADKVESRRHLAPEEYVELLGSQGFKVVRQQIEVVQMNLESWLSISQFEDFIEGIMPGVPLDKASQALKTGVMQTFEELGLKTVPRNWLEIVAVKA